MDKLEALKDYMYYFQFTLNSYGADVEKNIPSKDKVIVPGSFFAGVPGGTAKSDKGCRKR